MKVWALGDAAVELLPMGNGRFQSCAGGAPVYVAVGAAKLGCEVGFLGRVGNDPFGRFLHETMAQYGVDVSRIEFDEKFKTNTAVIDLAQDGKRHFSLLASPSADQFLTPQCLPEFGHDIFHFCSAGLVGDLCRTTIKLAIERIKVRGIVSFDVRLCAQIWPNRQAMCSIIAQFAHYADILKLSDDELFWLTATPRGRWQAALSKLSRYRAQLIVVTCADAGCLAIWNNSQYQFNAYLVDSIDAAGAGDAFMAGLLNGIVQHGFPATHELLTRLITEASACGALATASQGVLPALPDQVQLQSFIDLHKPLIAKLI